MSVNAVNKNGRRLKMNAKLAKELRALARDMAKDNDGEQYYVHRNREIRAIPTSERGFYKALKKESRLMDAPPHKVGRKNRVLD